MNKIKIYHSTYFKENTKAITWRKLYHNNSFRGIYYMYAHLIITLYLYSQRQQQQQHDNNSDDDDDNNNITQ